DDLHWLLSDILNSELSLSTDPGPKPPRWCAERRASRVMGRKAPRRVPGLPRQTRRGAFDAAGPTGAAAPGRLSVPRPPLAGWKEVSTRGRRAAGTNLHGTLRVQGRRRASTMST